MHRVPGPDGPIEVLATGRGQPTTVFAHGLAGSIDETRPFGSGVDGTKVFLHFRGHGATLGPDRPWTYAGPVQELATVVEAYDARRGLGVSLGAGTLIRLAAEHAGRFERLVLVLPAAIDRPRDDPAVDRMQRLAEQLEQGDLAGVAASLVAEQPAGVRGRPDVHVWASRQAQRLSVSSVTRALRELPALQPLDDRAALSAVTCPVLVVGQEGDEAHPAAIARELTAALPDARAEIFDEGGMVWSHRGELRALIGGFLNA